MKTRNTLRHQFNYHIENRFIMLGGELRSIIVYDHYKSNMEVVNRKLHEEALRLHLNPDAISDNASYNYAPNGTSTYCSNLMFVIVPDIQRYGSPFLPNNMIALCAWADLPYVPLPMEEHDLLRSNAANELKSLLLVSASTLRSIFRANTSIRALIKNLDEASPYYRMLLDEQDRTTGASTRTHYPIPNLSRICTMFLCVGAK